MTEQSGSPESICEVTSVTKLPRRVFTFSKSNLIEAIKYNDTGCGTFISINFANYVDHKMTGVKSKLEITSKFKHWLEENMGFLDLPIYRAKLKFIGTGAKTNEMIEI